MDECEHDFRFGDSINTTKGVGFVLAVATCLHCNQSLGPKEIEARLNAMERLDIDEITKWVTAQHILDMLQDVANILEGKDE